jgi:hypothetical protein
MRGTLKAGARHSMVERSFKGQNQSRYVEHDIVVTQTTGFRPWPPMPRRNARHIKSGCASFNG